MEMRLHTHTHTHRASPHHPQHPRHRPPPPPIQTATRTTRALLPAMAFTCRVEAPCLLVLLTVLFSSALPDAPFCTRDTEDELCIPEEYFKLTRLNGMKVNHTWTVHTNDYRALTLRTVCMEPQIIEVPHFLSDEECDHVIQLAQEAGLSPSDTYTVEKLDMFKVYDSDEDGRITLEEMKFTLEITFSSYVEVEDILILYKTLGLYKRENGEITREELMAVPPELFRQLLSQLTGGRPETLHRLSSTAWLHRPASSSPAFRAVQKRFAKLVRLPLDLVRVGECQVVKYGVEGHFNGHWDSSFPVEGNNLPCCLGDRQENCKLCRYLTGLIYLNDVKKGGETAFPFVENAYPSSTADLYRHCDQVKLKISPAKGKLLLWYNFFLDPQTKWKGAMDPATFHGGCRVKEGEKWVANFWVRVPDSKEDTLQLMSKVPQD